MRDIFSIRRESKRGIASSAEQSSTAPRRGSSGPGEDADAGDEAGDLAGPARAVPPLMLSGCGARFEMYSGVLSAFSEVFSGV